LIRRSEDWHEGHVAGIDEAGGWQWMAPVAATLLVCRPVPFWRPWLGTLRGRVPRVRQGSPA
jgi:hypothetical protein